MTHPTKNKGTIGYRFWVKTYYSPHHLGLDLFLPSSPVYAPLDGWVTKTGWDTQIGNYIVLKTNDNKYHRFCHLSRIDVGIGSVIEGQQLGMTGNTGKMGTVTYSYHLHWDIWNAYPNVSLVKQTWNKNLLIDPEIYFKSKEDIVLKDKRSFKFNTDRIYGRFSDVGEWTIATGKTDPLQMTDPAMIKFKGKDDCYVKIANSDAAGEMLGTNWQEKITELDLVQQSDLDAAQRQIGILEGKIKELEKGEEAVKQGILDRIIVFFKGIIGIK